MSRGRFASEDELGSLKQAIDKAPEQYAAFFKLLILTGARPTELLSARTTNVKDGKIELPDSKSGYPRVIHLSKQAQDILANMAGVRPGERYFKFTSKVAAYQWRKVREQASCPDIRMYPDLRRTFATTALSAGVSLDHVGIMLGHTSLKHTRVYAKLIDKSANAGAETAAAALNI